MRIQYWTEVGGSESRYSVIQWGVTQPVKHCCHDMKSSWGLWVTLFHSPIQRHHAICVGIVARVEMHNRTSPAYIPITHCPWCGDRFELVRVSSLPPRQPSGQTPEGKTA
jgi:hypothetical protein